MYLVESMVLLQKRGGDVSCSVSCSGILQTVSSAVMYCPTHLCRARELSTLRL